MPHFVGSYLPKDLISESVHNMSKSTIHNGEVEELLTKDDKKMRIVDVHGPGLHTSKVHLRFVGNIECRGFRCVRY
jgi:hypothetical protein